MSSSDKGNNLGRSPMRTDKTYTQARNTLFYTTVPSEYKQYYERFVREWLQWYDGEVDGFHGINGNGYGIFSTRLAFTIADKLAKQITGGKALFNQSEDETETVNDLSAKDFMYKWSRKNRLDPKLNQAFQWALAAGDSVVKLDAPKRGWLVPSVVRKDNYFLDTDFFGNIIKFSTLVHTMTRQVLVEGGTNKEHYYLMEERRYDNNDNPEIRLTIKKGHAHGVNYKNVDFHSADYSFNDLTKSFRDELKKLYPNTMFGKWEKLPLRDLGVYMIKNTEGVSFMPSLPYGESMYSNAIHLLMGYDFYYSAKMTDIYLGRGKVLTPRGMDNPAKSGDYYQVLDDLYYEKVPYMNPEDQKPMSIQFDLRSQSWKEIRDALLQELATAIGLSPRTLASYSVPASEKPTAHEISVDQDDTALTIETKREINEPQLNELILTVLDYYDYSNSEVNIKFSKMGQVNMATMVNQVAILKQNRLIDDITALEMVFPDKTPSEINDIIERKNKERDELEVKKDTENDVLEQQEQTYNNKPNHVPKPNEDGEVSED